jgi:hypothetical protein
MGFSPYIFIVLYLPCMGGPFLSPCVPFLSACIHSVCAFATIFSWYVNLLIACILYLTYHVRAAGIYLSIYPHVCHRSKKGYAFSGSGLSRQLPLSSFSLTALNVCPVSDLTPLSSFAECVRHCKPNCCWMSVAYAKGLQQQTALSSAEMATCPLWLAHLIAGQRAQILACFLSIGLSTGSTE